MCKSTWLCGGVLLGSCLISVIAASEQICDNAKQEAPGYLDFSTFRDLTSLIPEAPLARPVSGLTDAGYELWAQGQLMLPASGYYAEGDFDANGTSNAALLLVSGEHRYLLVAERAGNRWIRKTLLRLAGESTLAWDGRTVVLAPPESFLEWDGNDFSLGRGPLALYAHAYGDSDFGTVLVKLTYIGPQEEPYPGLLFSSYYRWPNLEAFTLHRRSDISYANDDLLSLWHVTAAPEVLRELVLEARRLDTIELAELRTGRDPGLTHSLSIVDTGSPFRPNPFEALLTQSETASLLRAASERMDRHDPAAAALLREYLAMFTP